MADGSPGSFGEKLTLALKVLNLSRGQLAAAVGVDKSLIGRWLSGQVIPTGHNLARISEVFAKLKPGFSTLTWERPPSEFEDFLGLTPAVSPAADVSRKSEPILPAGMLTDVRRGVERNGAAYEGHWACWRPGPGGATRSSVLAYRKDDYLRCLSGDAGLESHGYLLPIEEHVFGLFFDVPDQTPSFIILNGVAMSRVEAIDGLALRQISGGLRRTAAAFPVYLERTGDLIGDEDADIAHYEDQRKKSVRVEMKDLTPTIRDFLFRDVGPSAAALGGDLVLLAPLARSLGRGTMRPSRSMVGAKG